MARRWRGIPFEAWLFRIRPAGDTVLGDGSDPHVEPERVVAMRKVRRELGAAIERLPRDQRDVVMLRLFAGRSIREAAQLLGRSEGATKQLQFRALASLRRRTGR